MANRRLSHKLAGALLGVVAILTATAIAGSSVRPGLRWGMAGVAGMGWFAVAAVILSDRRSWTGLQSLLTEQRAALAVAGETEASLRESEERLRTIIDTSLNAVLTMDEAGLITGWSARAETVFGWKAAEVVGLRLADVIIPEAVREAHTRGLARFLATGDGPVLGQVLQVDALHRDGREFPVELAISPPVRTDGRMSFVAFLRDVSDRVRADRLRALGFAVTRVLADAASPEEAVPRVLSAIGESLEWRMGTVWTLDSVARVLRAGGFWDADPAGGASFRAATAAMTFASGVGLPGRVWAESRTVVIDNVTMHSNFQRRAVAVEAGVHGAVAFPIISGQDITGVVELFSDKLTGLAPDDVAALEDIGCQLGQFMDRKKAETALAHTIERLEQLASTDQLTGVRNRREFDRALSSLPRQDFAVLAADVDNLKAVNDEFGHEAGDVLLQAVAMTLSSMVRGQDVVARVGGDEFAVFLLGVTPSQAADAAERMREVMHSTSVPYGRARLSIGWACGSVGADPNSVWRAADVQLYAAKTGGRDRVAGGVPGLTDGDGPVHGPGGSRWSAALIDCLEHRQVASVYQPILDLASRTVIGYEALARPTGVEPTESVEGLFATAMRCGRMRDLDWLCRRVAIAGAPISALRTALFVNISAAALLDPVHGVDQMLLVLRAAGRSPEDLVLEITERERITDIERLRWVLAAFREHGFRFALDDVGEGHSTIEVLAASNPEYIKIARSLVTTAATSGSRSAIKAAVTFARASGARVIAEGIESEFTTELMIDLGVTEGQGFWLGIPMTAATIEATPPRLIPARDRCA